MSDDDPIPIPTNGHRPPLGEATSAAPAPAGPAPSAGRPVAPGPGTRPAAATAATVRTGTDPRLVLTPGQLATGFGVLAGLLVLAWRARRRGKRG